MAIKRLHARLAAAVDAEGRPDEVLRARVAARRNDASDADLRVLDRQLAERPVVTDWRHVDAAATLTAQCAAVRAG